MVLGVTFNLEDFLLEIKEERKAELVESIDAFLDSGTLDPGTAGKVKGKLMFGASQVWGKVGRAFFRPLSERQYSKDLSGDRMDLNEALKRSLIYWRGLIEFGPHREISLHASKRFDIVIFTDGFTPDQRKAECRTDRVGAVIFDRWDLSPKQFTEVISPSISEKWIPRRTQIVPIEMIAPILALETFRDHVRNKDVILLIDSEAVEASLVIGYSSKEDLYELVQLFWELSLEYRTSFLYLPTGRREIISRSASRRSGKRFSVRGLRLSHEKGFVGLGEALVLRVGKIRSRLLRSVPRRLH